MKQLLSFSVLIAVFFGCQDVKKPKKPDNLIAKDKMSDILYDVFVMNAAKSMKKQTLEDNGIHPEQYVFNKHGIDSMQFAKSNDYYAYDVEAYDAIVKEVEKRIDAQKKHFDSIREVEEAEKTRKQDSIKKVKDSIRAPRIPKKVIAGDSLRIDALKKLKKPLGQ
ncbi:DUF4296 domain-containing protein [Mangrovimonas sp. YM274]|uniref:DUF4296 domain-containing protein n=1 Tax=Mangrovimonas sp. YM274 TaxID=3070660 RepID=UPI0027DB6494|nr:DUF4296 domain-containing protein [Mangrovimonas sp. YM274]WMI69333.1 DUF4296 domain-containing protein [Mangrovimonas sp. YM274]